jgi:hypothetical protein
MLGKPGFWAGKKRGPHSPETIARMRVAAAVRTMSAEGRLRLSMQRKGRRVAEETKEKLRAALAGKPKTTQHIARAAAAQVGKKRRPFTDEEKARAREKQLSIAKYGREHHAFGKSSGHVKRIEHCGTIFRSSYEVRFAQMLDRMGVRWEYEPKRFDLGDCTYMPDFFLPEYRSYYEVKGWLTETAERKMRLFRELNPGIPLVLVPKDFFISRLDGPSPGTCVA